MPDFQRTVIESPERTAKESVDVIADEPDMPPGKYTWEKTPAPKSLTEEKPLVIPKIKVCELKIMFIFYKFVFFYTAGRAWLDLLMVSKAELGNCYWFKT